MGNSVTYDGKLLATYYLEKKGEIIGYAFEFNGLEGLETLLQAPPTNKTEEGPIIADIKLMLSSDECLGIFLSPQQRYINRCKS